MSSKKQNKNSRNIFLGCIVLILGAVMFASIIKTEYIPHRNSVDTEISQYSDQHITPNAIDSDPKFKNIILANSQGIAVDAEAGWQNWAESGNTYKAFAIIDYVKNFNDEHKNKFRGFQYDVEPYMLPSYKKNKTTALKNFVELVDQTENFLSDTDLRFSIVIPDFYDKKDALTPRVWFDNRKDFAFNHLLNILDRRAGNSIIVMSYRNFADGPDGAIEVSKNEMISVDKGFHQTKIIIAQETGDVPPPYITFHNTSKNYFLTEVAKINKTFEKYDNFGGIAIHYANAFLALK